MEFLGAIVVSALGLVMGSFVGAYSWRLPRRISVVVGRSFCPKCRQKISWYDNIPVVSFILLGGKCRQCGKKISLRYLAIEVAGALSYLFLYLYFPFNLTLFYYLFVSSLLLAIFVIDWEHQIIPDKIVFVGYLATLLFLFLQGRPVYENIFSGFAAGLFLVLIYLVTFSRGMGLGDVKLALFVGTLFGPEKTITWLFSAFILGAAIGILLILAKKAAFGRKIAFGPFLVLSWYVAWIIPWHISMV